MEIALLQIGWASCFLLFKSKQGKQGKNFFSQNIKLEVLKMNMPFSLWLKNHDFILPYNYIQSVPSKNSPVQSQQYKQKKVLNIFKINKKTPERRRLSFLGLYCYLWTYLTPFSSIFIFDFGQVFLTKLIIIQDKTVT